MTFTTAEAVSPPLEPDSTIRFLEEVIHERNGMSFSEYDTAFALAAETLNPSDQQRLIDRLNSRRQTDFTWGEGAYLPHSTVLNTLAVVWAYDRLGIEIPDLDKTAKSLDAAIVRCRDYPNHPTVAFEFLAPLMSKRLENTLCLNTESQEYLNSLYSSSKQKLDFVRAKMGFFNPSHTLSFTAELALFIDDFSDEEVMQFSKSKLLNGSIGLSPAATAGTIVLLKDRGLAEDEELKKYLADTLEDYEGEGFPGVHPYEHMKYLWHLLPLIMSGDIDRIALMDEGIQLLASIYGGISHDAKGRVSWDPLNSGAEDSSKGLPDLDDTSLAYCLYLTLLKAGINGQPEMSLEALKGFRRENGTFFCYPLETHPSPVAIMHALKAIELGSEVYGEEFRENPEVKEITESLLGHLAGNPEEPQEPELLCHDKWHCTWTYGFQRWTSIKPVVQHYPEIVNHLTNFALKKEIEGGWGQNGPTLEETSYVASGLIKLLELSEAGIIDVPQETKKGIYQALSRTKGFLDREIQSDNGRPALWIAKTPYLPAWHKSAILNLKTMLSSANL